MSRCHDTEIPERLCRLTSAEWSISGKTLGCVRTLGREDSLCEPCEFAVDFVQRSVFYFFLLHSRHNREASSGVPPWRSQSAETLVNRGHGACSVHFSHRTWYTSSVLLCDLLLTTYCVMLPKELSLPWDCWSAQPLPAQLFHSMSSVYLEETCSL